MYIIVYEIGSFPNVFVLPSERGCRARTFKSRAAAYAYACNNCAWKFKVIKWD